jgi:hypothetical protein
MIITTWLGTALGMSHLIAQSHPHKLKKEEAIHTCKRLLVMPDCKGGEELLGAEGRTAWLVTVKEQCNALL